MQLQQPSSYLCNVQVGHPGTIAIFTALAICCLMPKMCSLIPQSDAEKQHIIDVSREENALDDNASILRRARMGHTNSGNDYFCSLNLHLHIGGQFKNTFD